MRKKSKVRESRFSGCLAYGFSGVFAAAGLFAFYFLTWGPIASIVEARSWEETTCVIVSSDVAVSDGGDTYRVDIRYTYEGPWGDTYRGDRYDFSTGSTSGYKGKARVVEAHPPGSEVACWVDPEDPSRAVINRSPGTFLLWGLFPLPFLAVGLGGLLLLATSTGRKTRTRRRPGRRASAPAAAGPIATRGPLELEPEASPVVKLVGIGCFALFWNGLLSVFLSAVILPSFRGEDPERLVAIFLIPFVLAGLGLIGAFLYQLLASFNPRPRLTLAESHLTPGAETSLRWRFSGRAGRIERLTIELEGREEARHRRGTDTQTDRHVFYSRELVSEEGRLSAIPRGSTTLEIPQPTMPTFEAPNNKIEWRIKVRGDVPFWPDVNQAFPIVVHPGGDGRR